MDNVAWLDPVGGLAVSALVIKAGWGNTGAALLELADVGVAEEIKDSVRRAIDKALMEDLVSSDGITGAQVEVGAIQGVKAGQNYSMSIEVAVPGDWSVDETRRIESVVRESVGAKVKGVRRVRVRFVARSTDLQNFTDEYIGPDVSPRSSPEPELESSVCGRMPSTGDTRRRH